LESRLPWLSLWWLSTFAGTSLTDLALSAKTKTSCLSAYPESYVFIRIRVRPTNPIRTSQQTAVNRRFRFRFVDSRPGSAASLRRTKFKDNVFANPSLA
jgi:hypothetical protein